MRDDQMLIQATIKVGQLINENSFGVMAAKLWNISPAEINYKISFKIALAKFLKDFPETPPTDGYTSMTNNTLLEWNLQKDHHQKR